MRLPLVELDPNNALTLIQGFELST
jgi:hypothetical protein